MSKKQQITTETATSFLTDVVIPAIREYAVQNGIGVDEVDTRDWDDEIEAYFSDYEDFVISIENEQGGVLWTSADEFGGRISLTLDWQGNEDELVLDEEDIPTADESKSFRFGQDLTEGISKKEWGVLSIWKRDADDWQSLIGMARYVGKANDYQLRMLIGKGILVESAQYPEHYELTALGMNVYNAGFNRHFFPYCLCGCGGTPKVGSAFIQGHDAKAKSILTKVAKGELTDSDIPTIMLHTDFYRQWYRGYATSPSKAGLKRMGLPANEETASE
jgi:hypothetical protein